MTTDLFAVDTDGNYRYIPNTYDGIKEAIGLDTPFDCIQVGKNICYYIDDEGMLNGSPLNVPASLFAGRPIWGPVVLAGGPDEEGDTLPPPDKEVERLSVLASRWLQVVVGALAVGQNLNRWAANPATIPPAQIISLDREQFDTYLRSGQIPAREEDQ